MSRAVPYILFYSIVFAVLLGLHLYIYIRIRDSLPLLITQYGILCVVVCAALFPAASLFETFYHSSLTVAVYMLSSVWLGFVFLLASVCILYEPVRLVLPAHGRISGWILVACAAALSVYGIANARKIRVKEVTIQLEGLSGNVTAALWSDVHLGTINTKGYLEKIVRITDSLNPDMVFVTGDLFDGRGTVSEDIVSPVRALAAEAFMVTGNHEKYLGIDTVVRALANSGITLLRNEKVVYKGIQIIGTDYPQKEYTRANEYVSTIPVSPDMPAVLLNHTPAGFEDAAAAGIDLQLSGHTHNGQIFPFTLLVKLFYPHTKGLYSWDSIQLYVSPGTGTWGPPMRIGSENEITLLHFVKSE